MICLRNGRSFGAGRAAPLDVHVLICFCARSWGIRSGGEGEPSSPPASLESIAFQTDAQVTEPETPQSRPVDTESLAKMVDLTLARDAERTRAEEERARAQAQQERALDLELKLASALSEVEATKKVCAWWCEKGDEEG